MTHLFIYLFYLFIHLAHQEVRQNLPESAEKLSRSTVIDTELQNEGAVTLKGFTDNCSTTRGAEYLQDAVHRHLGLPG